MTIPTIPENLRMNIAIFLDLGLVEEKHERQPVACVSSCWKRRDQSTNILNVASSEIMAKQLVFLTLAFLKADIV